MLKSFFDVRQDSRDLFHDLDVMNDVEVISNWMNKFPVIYVTFKDVKCETWAAAYDMLTKILRNEFERHGELLQSSRISQYEKAYMDGILRGTANHNDYAMALLNLSRMLDEHWGIAPVIIIDEYDTPIQQGYDRGYYEQIVDFMRILFSGGLKDNSHLSFGFLTGILRAAKEGIFSGLNNLKVNSILDHRYSMYFGFTREEVRAMAEYYNAADKFEEICAWYDGYRFGKTDIFKNTM